MTFAEVKNILATVKPALHKRFGVSEIGVFGSWVRGEQSQSSDIDVLVEFDKPLDLFDLMELQEFLEEVLGRKIDLALRRSLKKYIGQHILAEVQYV